jgi:aminopeptidase
MPLAIGGTVADPFTLTLRGGDIVEVTGGAGVDVVRAQLAVDAGARRLGELALVDGTSAVGESGRVFLETLLDENATCHIAWGAGIPSVFPGWRNLSDEQLAARGVNQSRTHIDFMVGGADLTVTGISADGTQVPILAGEHWVLPGSRRRPE